ncbi:MAG TPA: hypothetical protein VEC57_13970 [Candidatus Limnocylindrales bacterium]|nr:hypothetical protein [Candidatus Limnocylindrales bacterium]
MNWKTAFAALAVAVVAAGCAAKSSDSVTSDDLQRIEEAANRAEAAANRAEAAADRASVASEKQEALFHKSMRK